MTVVFRKALFLLVISMVVFLDAYAAEVYRTVDENGNVVFSDKKTHGAETIKVQPNVVELNIPDVPVTSSQGKSNKSATSSPTSGQQEMSGWNSNNGNNLRRRVRTQTNGEGVNRPKATVTPGRRAGGR